MAKETHQFSIWRLEKDGAFWMQSRIAASDTRLAIREFLKEKHAAGMYFVCDPGYNCNGNTSYGPTNFWLDHNQKVSIVRSIQVSHIEGDNQRASGVGLEVKSEVIEI